MADLADNMGHLKKTLDISVGDVVCFRGDYTRKAGVGIVMGFEQVEFDVYDLKDSAEKFTNPKIFVFWVEKGTGMWMSKQDIMIPSLGKD
jgi:hypothetical protein